MKYLNPLLIPLVFISLLTNLVLSQNSSTKLGTNIDKIENIRKNITKNNFLNFNYKTFGRHPSMAIPWYADFEYERKCLNDACRNSTNGFELEYKGKGRIDVDFFHLHTYGAFSVSIDMIYNPGKPNQRVSKIQFIGWNFLITQTVDRYLIIDGVCTTYKQWYNFPGDPIKTELDRFDYVSTDRIGNFARWAFEKTIPNGNVQTSYIKTDIDGTPLQNLKIETSAGSPQSLINTNYYSRSTNPDESIFYKYKDYNCRNIDGHFKSPEVCIEGVLALEYDCN